MIYIVFFFFTKSVQKLSFFSSYLNVEASSKHVLKLLYWLGSSQLSAWNFSSSLLVQNEVFSRSSFPLFLFFPWILDSHDVFRDIYIFSIIFILKLLSFWCSLSLWKFSFYIIDFWGQCSKSSWIFHWCNCPTTFWGPPASRGLWSPALGPTKWGWSQQGVWERLALSHYIKPGKLPSHSKLGLSPANIGFIFPQIAWSLLKMQKYSFQDSQSCFLPSPPAAVSTTHSCWSCCCFDPFPGL